MAAMEKVGTSFNFLRSSSSKDAVLVVGDGNFSFSLCLALHCEQVKSSTQLVLTSFDDRETLIQDELTRININRLEKFRNVRIFHDIDATLLSRNLPGFQFGRIIFNFPHTGGKSNIKSCRKLLEDFFLSAIKKLKSSDSDICVTLCKGQGGTPGDEPQRLHGNSWQIVYNAAKAGLMLDQLEPFVSLDFTHYKSVGYRGRLSKGFCTKGGLIHIFIRGQKLYAIDDIREKQRDVLLLYVYEKLAKLSSTLTHSNTPVHPYYDTKKKMLEIAVSVTQTMFEEIRTNKYCEEMPPNSASNKDNLSSFECKSTILSAMKLKTSFSLTATALNVLEEITCDSNIYTKYLFLCKFYNHEDVTFMKKQKEEVVKRIKNVFSRSDKYLEEFGANELLYEKCDLIVQNWINSSDVAHKSKRKYHMKKGLDIERMHHKSSCSCRKLCEHYLDEPSCTSYKTGELPLELLDKLSLLGLQLHRHLFLVSGFLTQEVLTSSGNKLGWLIIVNLDIGAMLLNNLTDIRLLSSPNINWIKLPPVEASIEDVNGNLSPLPRNLHPPEYIHDISFWISDSISQKLFFISAVALSENCLRSIKMIEIYHDEEGHRVSFNYRMTYSRSDGPLSHLEAVELQNRLRRALIVLGFGLK